MRRTSQKRAGGITVLSAAIMVVMIAMLCFAIDLGFIQVTRGQLQRCADAASIAAAWELIDEELTAGITSKALGDSNVRTVANEYAGYNKILTSSPVLSTSDVEIGYLSDPSDPAIAIDTSSSNLSNCVRVRVRRTANQNGAAPLFFGKLFGMANFGTEMEATAAFINNFRGFQAPSDGSNLGFLPFALDYQTWQGIVNNSAGTDNYSYDSATGTIVSGSDGIREGNLFPQGTGSPGNRGTVDIGSNNNSTQDIARQILHGVTPADLAHHGGKLELDSNGHLFLNGDTGISAGVKDELASIIGTSVMIPIFDQVTGNGNNATYRIVGFGGVRILDVKLTGKMSGKHVTIQPAAHATKGGIVGGPSTTYSNYVFSAPWIVR